VQSANSRVHPACENSRELLDVGSQSPKPCGAGVPTASPLRRVLCSASSLMVRGVNIVVVAMAAMAAPVCVAALTALCRRE
jgi:hypothetical protein